MAHQQTPALERALQAAADRKASDLFLLPDEPVTFRVNDRIVRSEDDALSEADVRAIALAAAGEERLAKLGEAGSVVTSCSLPGVWSTMISQSWSRSARSSIATRRVP